MTEKDRAERLTRARAQQDAIRAARETAQFARLLWPRDVEVDLHDKVQMLIGRVRRASYDDAGQGIADVAKAVAQTAHNAAWRKYKHTHHISDEGQASRHASSVAYCTHHAIGEAAQALLTADPSLIDNAYWLAEECRIQAEGMPHFFYNPNCFKEQIGPFALVNSGTFASYRQILARGPKCDHIHRLDFRAADLRDTSQMLHLWKA